MVLIVLRFFIGKIFRFIQTVFPYHLSKLIFQPPHTRIQFQYQKEKEKRDTVKNKIYASLYTKPLSDFCRFIGKQDKKNGNATKEENKYCIQQAGSQTQIHIKSDKHHGGDQYYLDRYH